MSERLTFQTENGKLSIKFDGQPIHAEKRESLFAMLAADIDRRVKQLSAAVADSQNGPIRVGAVQIGICGDDDPKTLPRLKTYDLTLYDDSRWKEDTLSKLEIILDDSRNDCADFSDIGESMEYGKTYRVTIAIEQLP